jgi:hypothetical protein
LQKIIKDGGREEDMLDKNFLKDAVERAIRTFAQAALAILAVDGVTVFTINWVNLLSSAAIASLISLLMSVAAGSTKISDSASFLSDKK